MKAFTNPPRIQFEEPASSFSWTEKLAACRSSANRAWRRRQPDEHNQSGILTWGVKPASRLPGPPGPVAVGVSSPTQWRNRPRFSRGSLAFGRVARWTHAHLFQRTGFIMRRSWLGAKQILARARLTRKRPRRVAAGILPPGWQPGNTAAKRAAATLPPMPLSSFAERRLLSALFCCAEPGCGVSSGRYVGR